MTIHQTSFDRRTFLKASGILAVGFSLSDAAGANTLGAPKSVAKEASQLLAHHHARQQGHDFLSARSISAPARAPR